jgi:protein CMS1
MSSPKIPTKSKKRAAEDAPAAKKGKKRKGNKQDDESLDMELGLNTLFQRMDNQLLADHLAQKLTRFGTDLSPVEVSDLTLSGELFHHSSDLHSHANINAAGSIQDTTSWEETRTLEKFPDFLEKFSEGGAERLVKTPKKKGSPHTIIVAGAGLRAADIVRYELEGLVL